MKIRHSPQDSLGLTAVPGPKKNPGEVDEEKGDQPCDRWGHTPGLPDPEAMNDKSRPMKGAPEDEHPTGSMPQTAEYECRHEVKVNARSGTAVPPQGNIEVVSQVATQGHVPSVPEILNI